MQITNIKLKLHNWSKRFLDILLALLLIIILAIPMLVIWCLVKFTSKGPAIYWSNRVGKNNKEFQMPKFRSMKLGTPTLPSDLLGAPQQYITTTGKWLRKTSLDELPQLWSILKGDMSFVGPRPALANQYALIQARTEHGISSILPGITGWAQINGRDLLSNYEKVALDKEYLHYKNLWFDVKILILTFGKVLTAQDISH